MGYKIPGICNIYEKEKTYDSVLEEFSKTELEEKGVELLGACKQMINDETYYPSIEERKYFGEKRHLEQGDFLIPMVTPKDIKKDKMYLDIDDVLEPETYHKEILVGLKINKPIKNKELGTNLSMLKEHSETTGFKTNGESLKLNGFLFPENKNLRDVIID
ncbi:MAG: hypothetical protein ACOC80_12440 [Petrotogales bacterium]